MGNVHGLDTFRALLDLGAHYGISAKEAEETILRVILRKLGLTEECKCGAQDMAVRMNKWAKPHCKRCWRFSEMEGKPGGKFLGRFKPIVSEFERDVLSVLTINGKLEDARLAREKLADMQGR